MSSSAAPFITVIVPVRNEARCIEQTITSLARQDYPPDRFEIIVADGCSTDNTPALVIDLQRQVPNLKLVNNPKRWSSAARNLGVQHGQGDLFVVIDGHCDIADRLYLQKLADAFERSGADSLGRPQPLEIHHGSPLQEAVAQARRSWFGHNPSSHIYSDHEGFVKASSVAVAYRRKVLEMIGGFDESFDACEDVEFNTRLDAAGLTCFFTPDIAVHYHPRNSLRGLFFQMSRYGRGRIRLAAKHPRALSLPALAPMLFFVTMMICAIAAIIYWPAIWFVAAGAGGYSFAVVAAVLAMWKRPASLRSRAVLPLVYMTIHVGFAWGTLREVFRQGWFALRSKLQRRYAETQPCG